MNKEKADMIIYTTEDGLTKVETTFDGDTVLTGSRVAEWEENCCKRNILKNGGIFFVLRC